ncbi:GGDEF domain-containing protein [Pleionea sp. CnH1-48]|uniref:GGDEF domain-containing protein n=1 Tax=Pleionea sp. CnH1-48 TaxID=2954494 RepID=UPI002097A635|nr:GGDEF domain-containing protein [Pleionea sp. CnH1-48]MCO7223313.1 GGDEF domain-containing protein [Pleionea sp. CnH1-48]
MKSKSVRNRLDVLKSQSIDLLITGFLVLGMIGVPISISRALHTGWLQAYTFHLLGLSFIAVVYWLRGQLSAQVKSLLLVFLTSGVSVVGLTNYGILGNGLSWAVFSLTISLFFLNRRMSVIISLVLTLVFLISMYRFVAQGVDIAGGSSQYFSSYSSWINSYFGTALIGVLIIGVVLNQRRQTAALLVEIEDQKKQIEHQANHDPLTGLPTLKLASDRLEMALSAARRGGHKTALLYLDLDEFKSINDNFGHDAGDKVLQITASRILSSVRDSDTACRIGGDEFIVIVSKVDEVEHVIALCTRLIIEVSKPIRFNEQELAVGISIGGSLFPDHAKESTALKKMADQYMYEAKRSGKNNYVIP